MDKSNKKKSSSLSSASSSSSETVLKNNSKPGKTVEQWISLFNQGKFDPEQCSKRKTVFNQKSNKARGFGRGKRLPVPATPTAGFRHLELSRVVEPTRNSIEPAEEVPATSSRTRHPELSRVTEPVSKEKTEPHPWAAYEPAADVYMYPAKEIVSAIEMVENHMDKVQKCWFYEELNKTVLSLYNETNKIVPKFFVTSQRNCGETRTWAEWPKREPDSTWGKK